MSKILPAGSFLEAVHRRSLRGWRQAVLSTLSAARRSRATVAARPIARSTARASSSSIASARTNRPSASAEGGTGGGVGRSPASVSTIRYERRSSSDGARSAWPRSNMARTKCDIDVGGIPERRASSVGRGAPRRTARCRPRTPRERAAHRQRSLDQLAGCARRGIQLEEQESRESGWRRMPEYYQMVIPRWCAASRPARSVAPGPRACSFRRARRALRSLRTALLLAADVATSARTRS